MVPSMMAHWEQRYCLIGPYDATSAAVEFEPAAPTGAVGEAVDLADHCVSPSNQNQTGNIHVQTV